MTVLGIDIGGTNINLGVVDDDRRFVARHHLPTLASQGLDDVIERLVAGINAVTDKAGCSVDDLDAIGVVVASPVDVDRGIALHSPNLQWINVPLKDILESRTGRPVVVDNDVNGAVWGEHRAGAGRGEGDVFGVWVGTGVGGGLVLNDRLYHGPFHTAGEIGQTVIEPHGGHGRRILEDFASRTGMSRTIRDALDAGEASTLASMVKADGIVSSADLATARDAGDALAIRVVDDAAALLGTAIANAVILLSVDVVIVGGGVTEALGSTFLDRIRTQFVADAFPERLRDCDLRMTTLEGDAGLLGAALLGDR